MNEFEEIDRLLAETYAQQPSTLSRPSLRDVKQRARRHQRQRRAGLVGACAVVGVGGAAVLATRTPARTSTTDGIGDSTASTICFPTMMPTTLPTYLVTDSTWPYSNGYPVQYIVQLGDNPTSVAQQFNVTLESLNAANADTPGYDVFMVGLEIWIPATLDLTTTTESPLGIAEQYTIAAGDYPGLVAEMFQVTVAELDSVNRDVNGYGGFIVGTVINIPFASQTADTTTTGLISTLPVTSFEATTTTGFVATETSLGVIETICYPVSPTTVVDTTATSTTIDNFMNGWPSVQVLNCSSQEGAAGALTDALAAEGFNIAVADTGTIDLPVTKVIYNPDDPNALPVAQSVALMLGNAVVEPSGPVVPGLTTGTWAPGSGVIVLLGDDFAGMSLAEIASINATGSTAPTTTLAP